MTSNIPDSVFTWLLQGDPAIRWQVQRDLLDEPASVWAAERTRIAETGWGARLLALQGPDGHWGGGTWIPRSWKSTFDVVWLLRELGLDPAGAPAQRAIALVRDNCTWGPEFEDAPFFEGETEACINGRTLAAGAYFGEPSERLLNRLLGEQMEDGGWNCYTPPSTRSSFHSTLCVLEALLEYEKARGPEPAVTTARGRGEEYLLQRRLLRFLSTGEIINPDWTRLSFPAYWHYDILRALDYFRSAGAQPDERMAEALELVRRKQGADGRWLLENSHPGEVHFHLEDGDGQPSRWITLRALRVMKWAKMVG